jgi:hypothetical protein
MNSTFLPGRQQLESIHDHAIETLVRAAENYNGQDEIQPPQTGVLPPGLGTELVCVRHCDVAVVDGT